jgi:NADH-quinone oxidoreductase subunit C
MTHNQLSQLADELSSILGDKLLTHKISLGQLTLEVDSAKICQVCEILRDQGEFEQLTDLSGVDYSGYGAEDGAANIDNCWQGERFAVVYHLISYSRNIRVRLRAQLPESNPAIDSVIDVWPGANWFEREAFDLFGIIFNGHPDLRRLLTDYGFIGHPFRKDFPLSGQVEMRYDEEQCRVVYQPVTVEERILVPRTIRKDVFATCFGPTCRPCRSSSPKGSCRPGDCFCLCRGPDQVHGEMN